MQKCDRPQLDPQITVISITNHGESTANHIDPPPMLARVCLQRDPVPGTPPGALAAGVAAPQGLQTRPSTCPTRPDAIITPWPSD